MGIKPNPPGLKLTVVINIPQKLPVIKGLPWRRKSWLKIMFLICTIFLCVIRGKESMFRILGTSAWSSQLPWCQKVCGNPPLWIITKSSRKLYPQALCWCHQKWRISPAEKQRNWRTDSKWPYYGMHILSFVPSFCPFFLFYFLSFSLSLLFFLSSFLHIFFLSLFFVSFFLFLSLIFAFIHSYYLTVSIPACLPFCQSICQSLCQSLGLHVGLPIYLSVWLSDCLTGCLSACQSNNVSIHSFQIFVNQFWHYLPVHSLQFACPLMTTFPFYNFMTESLSVNLLSSLCRSFHIFVLLSASLYILDFSLSVHPIVCVLMFVFANWGERFGGKFCYSYVSTCGKQ